MADNFPASPGNGSVLVAAKADASNILHQQVINEYLDAGGQPSTVSKTNPLPVSSRNVAQSKTFKAASDTAVTISSAGAYLSGFDYFNNSETETAYIRFYNTASPTSASTAQGGCTWAVPPLTSLSKNFPEPIEFLTAIGVRVTTGIADNDAVSPTGSNLANAYYRLI